MRSEPSRTVSLLATQCAGAAWAVSAGSVERIVRRSEWLDQPPLDVAESLALRSLPDALERVLVVQGGTQALLSHGELALIEVAKSDVQSVPGIVYGGAPGPVRSVVLEAMAFPILIFDLDSLQANG